MYREGEKSTPKPKLYSVAICDHNYATGETSVAAHTIEALSMRDARQEAENIIAPFVNDGDDVLISVKQVTDKYILTSRKLRLRQESLAG